MSSVVDELRDRCEAEGQGHLLRFWDELSEGGRARLAWQIQGLDLALLRELRGALRDGAAVHRAARFEPPALFPLQRDTEQRQRAAEAVERGRALLAAGRVGYVTVAGGQGSRLGFDGPKGLFPVGPVSGASLFAWHAARLAAARARDGVSAPWYVMTSQSNDAATRAFFEREDWFGLDAGDVRFFQQPMLPALDGKGRVVMCAKDSLFLAPNGHGGTLAALAASGCLADARERGVEVLSYFQVDNPLARPADPLFIGLHDMEGAAMSSKVVAKQDPDEKVGVLGLSDGGMGCIEYSDLPDDLRHARDGDGRLVFRAGNIGCHLLTRDFVEELASGDLSLPWHLARKEMDVVGEDGEAARGEGIKFETFVFDALRFARRSVTLEVERAVEFSPIKNPDGTASLASCRRDLTEGFARWLEVAGVEAPPRGDDGCVPVEVDPRFAGDVQEFRARMPARPEELKTGHLYR